MLKFSIYFYFVQKKLLLLLDERINPFKKGNARVTWAMFERVLGDFVLYLRTILPSTFITFQR